MPSTVSMRLPTMRRPFLQQIEIGARQRVLIIGIALPPAGADVLRRKHEQADARDPIEISCAGDRSPAAVDTPPRSAGGLRLMNIGAAIGACRRRGRRRCRATEPMPATAGSAITMSASCCCRPSID